MGSNVYLACGTFNSVYVMKVGKANSVMQRQFGLPIRIKSSLACPSEFHAFNLEENMREFARKLGAVQIPGHIDYFEYDADIYQQLEQFLTADLFAAPADMYRKHTSLDDLEIEAIQAKYQELKQKELEPLRKAAANQYAERCFREDLAEAEARVADNPDDPKLQSRLETAQYILDCFLKKHTPPPPPPAARSQSAQEA